MMERKPHLIERLFDGAWDRFAAATEWLKDVVDVQPWTHFFLGVALWFTIVWLKDQNWLFHLAWMPWAWYCMVIVGAPFRIGNKY
jgi:hypothetical protein